MQAKEENSHIMVLLLVMYIYIYILITCMIVAYITVNCRIIGLQESFYCCDQSQKSCCHISIATDCYLIIPPQAQGG
jgi:hypothetical protein